MRKLARSLSRKLWNASQSTRVRRSRFSQGAGFESLENRTMLSLLGVTPTTPSFTYDSTGHIQYTASADTFDLTATPLTFKASVATPPRAVITPASVAIHAIVDNSGNLVSGVPGDDLVVTGSVDTDGDSVIDYTGVLVTGEITGFGYNDTGSNVDMYDMRFTVTGGSMASYWSGKDIGVVVTSENSTFVNDFSTDFSGGAKGTIGAITQQLGSISGIKYQDTTGDGFSADDTPLGGVTINLFKDADSDGMLTGADGPAVASTITDSVTGAYSFTGLSAGTYFVQEVTQAGYSQTAPGSPGYYTVALGGGVNVTGDNFDNVKLLNISGTKFEDTTGNGLSGDDSKLGGTTINLFRDVDNDGVLTAADGAAIATTVSAAGTGAFSFGNLLPGRYFVQEQVPAGYQQTAPGGVGYYTVNLGGGDSTGNDFDNVKYGSISGQKFTDITGNGLTGDDTGLGGTTIDLYKDVDNDGMLTGADGSPIASTTTASGTGAYSFGNLLPGTYFVAEEVPSGYQRTTPNNASSGIYVITITSGTNSTGNNFANTQYGSISGSKFLDITGNGFSGDDTGLGGTTINLYNDVDNSGTLTAADGAAIATTVSASGTGAYSFANLLPGNYLVQEVAGSGYSQTAPTGNGGVYAISLNSGSNSTGNNFDNAQLGSISGIKYLDITGNGFSADDTGLGGTTINLYKDVDGSGTLTGADGAAIATTVSASGTGAYSFTNLTPGKYLVQEVAGAGYSQTAPTANGGVYAVTINSGTNATGSNFDNQQFGSISGIKYKDITGNGFSADDTPLGGTTINLYKDVDGNGQLTGADGAAIATTVTASGTGAFSFSNLAPGKYLIQEVAPTGYYRTAPTANGGVYAVTLNSGTNSTGSNYDNAQYGSISGTKYKDLTGNGFSADDTGFAGVTINLYKDMNADNQLTGADGSPVATTVTGTGGTYSFANLQPGTYFVQEVVPSGYARTAPTANNGVYTVNLTSGASCGGNNFDNVALSSISGTKFLDVTGNGKSSDDTKLGGTTIQLYKDVDGNGILSANDGAPIATTVSAATTGAWSFGNLLPGKYIVAEVVPTGYIFTGPTNQDYYSINVASGGTASTGNDFYNFCEPVCCATNIIYCVNGVNYTTLAGHTTEGATVKVTFTIPTGKTSTVTLVAYEAPGSTFDANTASQQTIFQTATGTYTAGTYSLTITLPKCYYQVDFVCGKAIDKFGPAGSNIFYTQENRLHSADNGGDNDCIDKMCAAPSYWVSTATGKGQLLIKAFNGGSTSKTLATWLASNFPKLFGASSITARNMTGKTNTDVAAMMVTLNNGGTSTSAEARILATALSVYATTTALGGTTASSYGFTVTAAGLGAANFSTETDGAAFGVVNGTYKTVMQMLVASNGYATSGVVWSSNSTYRSQCLAEFTNITGTGGLA